MKKRIIDVYNNVDEEVDLTAEEISEQEVQRTEYLASDLPNQHERVQEEKANKTSAKAKLIAGEALTEAEADTIVL